MKLFTKSIDKKLFAQYDKGSDLKNQKVIAKIFNPYGRGTWYILNSDPEDPDYLWAITDLFEIEIGSVSRNELENIKVPPFRLPLERDMYFDEINAYELYQGLKEGKRYDDGGYMEDDDESDGMYDSVYEINIKEGENKVPYYIVRDKIDGEDVGIYDSLEDAQNWIKSKQYGFANGGFMAKGGITKDSIKRTLTSDTSQYFLEKDGDGYILTITPRGAMNSNFYYKFHVESLPNDNTRLKYRLSRLGYAKGGYMANGGYISSGKKLYDVSNNMSDKEFQEAYLKLSDREKDIYDKLNNEYENGGEVETILVLPKYLKDEIEESINLGYDELKVGMISKNRKGVALVNENYEVRGTYDMALKNHIENIIEKHKTKKSKGGYMANGGFLKDAKYVSNRNISSITLELDGKSVTLKGEDLVDGVYVKKTKSATKTPTKTKVDVKEVANKLSDLYYDVWDKLKIESGSQIYSSDATQKKLNKELKNIGIDEIYSKLTKPERKKVSDILTDENQHSLRNYLGLRGYNGEQEYNSYVTMYEDNMKNYKRAYVLNPKNFDRVLAEGGGLGDSTYLVEVAEEYAEKEYGKKVKKGAGVAKAKKVGDKYDYSEVTVFFQDGTQETFEREDFEEFFEIED